MNIPFQHAALFSTFRGMTMRNHLRLWLFLCLLPALLILLVFAGLSGYVVHSRLQADHFVDAVLAETSTIQGMQTTMHLIQAHSEERPIVINPARLTALRDEMEQLFYRTYALCDEPDELEILTRIATKWGTLHTLIERLLSEQMELADTSDGMMPIVQTAAQQAGSILVDLDALQTLVHDEITVTATATQFARSQTIVILSLTFSLVVASLVALWIFFSRLITYPIETIRVGVEQLCKGDWNYRLRLERNDDLGVIAQAVNDIAARLQNTVSWTASDKQLSAERQTDLPGALDHTVRVQEAERKRIALDVHDGVNQWLVGALFELEAARVRLPADLPQIGKHLETAKHLLDTTKTELHRTIYGLHPHLLTTHGLVEAIRLYLGDLHRQDIVHCVFTVEGTEKTLPMATELALFRVVQEGLNNIVQHAETDMAALTLRYKRDSLQLTLVDSGKGFNLHELRARACANLGLLSMSERIAAVGGFLLIESKPGGGTQVVAKLPLVQNELPVFPYITAASPTVAKEYAAQL